MSYEEYIEPYWTIAHDTLESVSDRKTTLMCTWKAIKNCKNLVYFMFQIFIVGIGNWSF